MNKIQKKFVEENCVTLKNEMNKKEHRRRNNVFVFFYILLYKIVLLYKKIQLL